MFVADSSQMTLSRLIWIFSKLIQVSNQLLRIIFGLHIILEFFLCWMNEMYDHMQLFPPWIYNVTYHGDVRCF